MSYTASPDALMTLHGFAADLAKFAKKLEIAPKVVVRQIAADLHGRISKRTPVDTGRARASWDIKQGEPSGYVPPAKDHKDTAGSAAAKDVSAGLAEITGKAPVFVTSALEYVKYLEDGSSSQAPAGMVRISMAEIEIEVEDVLSQL